MIPRGPRFLDEDERPPEPIPGARTATPDPAQAGQATLPRGPMLLEPQPDAAERLELEWMPESIAIPRSKIGAAFWIGAGLSTLVLAWLALSIASFVLSLFQQSSGLGSLAALAVVAGLAMISYAALLEIGSYRSLGTVEQLRATLAAADTTVTVARREGRAWLNQVRGSVPDPVTVERMVEAAASVAELRAVLRAQVADHLRDAASAIGRRAAVEGATIVAICPHPAWDGVIAGARALFVIRRVAALYGLRPGLSVMLALLRRVAWTAAGTSGLALVSQGLADHALANLPVIKHVAGALPETGAVAVRLYRLARVTAEACSPLANSAM